MARLIPDPDPVWPICSRGLVPLPVDVLIFLDFTDVLNVTNHLYL
jgi:hypothetical protein